MVKHRRLLASSLVALLFGAAAPSACSSTKAEVTPDGEGGEGGEAGGAPVKKPVVAPGGTGAFGIIVVDGVQKMYLPLAERSAVGNGLIAVVNVGITGEGVKGSPALIHDIDLGSAADGGFSAPLATTTSGTAEVVIAASTQFPDIWFIDPKHDTVTKHIQLDAAAGRSSFSGGGGYVTGIAMDPEHHRAILSVWNGFAIVDLDTQEITKTIEAPPAENFGFDSTRGLILDPFYECSQSRSALGVAPASCNSFKNSSGTVITDGLAIIDLSDDSVYNYDDPSATSPRTPAEPVGREPDSAAADPALGVVIVPSESGSFQNIIDFGHAKYDAKTGFVTARNYVLPGFGLTGVAIEPERHLALLEEESSSTVAALDLSGLIPRLASDAESASAEGGAPGEGGAPAEGGALGAGATGGGTGGSAAGGGAGTDTGIITPTLIRAVQASMPLLPVGSSWSNIGDPHGVAVTTGVSDGRSVGFLVNSQRQWVARIDLSTFLELSTGATSTTLTNISTAVTFLDARTRYGAGEGGEGGAGGAAGAGGATN